MANKDLTLREKEVLKNFALNVNKEFQKLNSCEDYVSVKQTMVDLEKALDTEKWAQNFNVLCKLIDE